MHIVDLPGIYSLTAYSAEERIARNFILDEKPDVVVDIIDASNLERNLYLAAIYGIAPLVLLHSATRQGYRI
jgi:ferrous iron transport protein B